MCILSNESIIKTNRLLLDMSSVVYFHFLRKQAIFTLWILLFFILGSCIKNPQSTEPLKNATYRLIFQSSWSAQTHPLNFPSNAHYSPIIGISHDTNFTLWQIGQLASLGIEFMAELGDNSLIIAEINTPTVANHIGSVFFGHRFDSPGQDSLIFTINNTRPFISFVCMLAPSPDWFTGITRLPLYRNKEWVDSLTIDLFVYDAGTDAGTFYRSLDIDTSPGIPISLLTSTDTAFQYGRPSIGRAKFIRIN